MKGMFKQIIRMVLISTLAWGTLGFTPGQPALAGGVLYVKTAATGSGNCDSWANACALKTAMGVTVLGEEIWMAEGVYRPDYDPITGTYTQDRYATFHFGGPKLFFGGFAGTETSREQRDWNVHVTILSGEIGNTNSINDNSYHVVIGRSGGDIYLDGITISGGNASGELCDYTERGGGLFVGNGSHVYLKNIIFQGNRAAYAGGGIFGWDGASFSLQNVTFIENYAQEGGGIALIDPYGVHVTRSTFLRNSASSKGGGAYLVGLEMPAMILDTTFKGNQALGEPYGYGGAIYNDHVFAEFINLVIAGNAAHGGGGIYNANGSNIRMFNVTLAANQAASPGGGGMYNNASSPNIFNTLWWENTAPTHAEIANLNGGTPTLNYSLVQSGCPTGANCTGLKNGNPLFVRNPSPGLDGNWGTADDDYGNLGLKIPSPAIDAGKWDASIDWLGHNDILNKPRVVDLPTVPNTAFNLPIDMGAYEKQLFNPQGILGTLLPGQQLEGVVFQYTVVINNTGSGDGLGVSLTGSLPSGLILAGPVVLDPPQPGAILAGGPADLPNLARDVQVLAGEILTFTLPLRVDDGPSSIPGFSLSLMSDELEAPIVISSTEEIGVENAPPIVDAGPDQTVVADATFSGTFTDTGALDTHSIHWDFGDGSTFSGALTTHHNFSAAGTYTVTLTVTDNNGGAGSDSLIVTVTRGGYAVYLPTTIRSGQD